jgi:transposase-like protein
MGGATDKGALVNRRWRSVEELRAIVEASLAPGASVARVARAHGVNANQVLTQNLKI